MARVATLPDAGGNSVKCIRQKTSPDAELQPDKRFPESPSLILVSD